MRQSSSELEMRKHFQPNMSTANVLRNFRPERGLERVEGFEQGTEINECSETDAQEQPCTETNASCPPLFASS